MKVYPVKNYKDASILLMLLKNRRIQRATAFDRYLLPEDVEELRSKSYTEKMAREHVRDASQGLSNDACAFCVMNKVVCGGCGYGERHGVCTAPDSDYVTLGGGCVSISHSFYDRFRRYVSHRVQPKKAKRK